MERATKGIAQIKLNSQETRGSWPAVSQNRPVGRKIGGNSGQGPTTFGGPTKEEELRNRKPKGKRKIKKGGTEATRGSHFIEGEWTQREKAGKA